MSSLQGATGASSQPVTTKMTADWDNAICTKGGQQFSLDKFIADPENRAAVVKGAGKVYDMMRQM